VYNPQQNTIVRERPAGVHESAGGLTKNQNIESLLADIVTRLDRIEEMIDEKVYPPESAMKPEFIRKIKQAHADIKKGKGKTYNSIDDFFK
jgi:hypothetical protein